MTDNRGPAYTAALAAADRQYTHCTATIEQQMLRTKDRVAQFGKTGAWACTAREICEQLDIASGTPGQFAAEMLAALLVERAERGDEADDSWPQI